MAQGLVYWTRPYNDWSENIILRTLADRAVRKSCMDRKGKKAYVARILASGLGLFIKGPGLIGMGHRDDKVANR